MVTVNKFKEELPVRLTIAERVVHGIGAAACITAGIVAYNTIPYDVHESAAFAPMLETLLEITGVGLAITAVRGRRFDFPDSE